MQSSLEQMITRSRNRIALWDRKVKRSFDAERQRTRREQMKEFRELLECLIGAVVRNELGGFSYHWSDNKPSARFTVKNARLVIHRIDAKDSGFVYELSRDDGAGIARQIEDYLSTDFEDRFLVALGELLQLKTRKEVM